MNIDEALGKVRPLAEPELRSLVDGLKKQFVAGLGDIGGSLHEAEISRLFGEAAEAKVKAFTASDAERQVLVRVYEINIKAIETYVLGAKIVADAKSASLIREMAKQVLDTLEIVAGKVIQTLVTAAISGGLNALTGGLGGPVVAAVTSAVSNFSKPSNQ